MIEPNKKLEIPNRKEDLIPFSKKLVNEYGDQAKSLTWLRKNGYGAFISRARKFYVKWSLFTTEANLKVINLCMENGQRNQ